MLVNEKSEYLAVKKFAQNLKSAILSAHDAIIAARVKQMTHSSYGAALHTARRQGHSHCHLTDSSQWIN